MSRLEIPKWTWWIGNEHNFTVGHGIWLRSQDRWVVPEFQRPLVWTVEQQILFCESVYLDLPIGSYVLNEDVKGGYIYQVLDGQQRWQAIFDYTDDKFPVFGRFYGELDREDQLHFQSKGFPSKVCRNLTVDQQKEVYRRLAYGGTPHELPEAGKP